MAKVAKEKLSKFVSLLERKFGVEKRSEPAPPPLSADADAAVVVARKNSQIIAEVILGLRGPPSEGVDAARRIMHHFVDWNEVRVSRVQTLIAVLGKLPRIEERIALMKRFLESYFLRRRNLNLEHLFQLKAHEQRSFLEGLSVFDRAEIPAITLTAFGLPGFPPDENLLEVLVRCGLLSEKTTALQMAKMFTDTLDANMSFRLYAQAYVLRRKYCLPETPNCNRCPLQQKCPTAKKAVAAEKAAEKAKKKAPK
jgi:hypothetical protein